MDPKLSRLIETNIDFDKANPKIEIYKSRLQNNTYSRNRQIRNKNIGNLRRISRIFKKKYKENEKANYLSGIANYIEELPEIVEESRNKGLPVLAEPAQPKSESRKSRSRSEDNRPKEPLEEDKEYEKRKDEERLAQLNAQSVKCKEDCKLLDKEIKELADIQQKKSIEGITIASNSKLIDLLIQRVLDPSPEWKKRIDTLINIPTSLAGKEYLRGGDYFEALFHLAIAIGVLPQFQGKFVRFYDIKDYRTMYEKPNYLHTETVQNSGGGQHGISDISFEVSSNQEFSPKVSNNYECGEVPSKVSDSGKVKGNPFYFISVKGYKKEKSIKSEYDIPLLDQQLQMFKDKDKHIIVCVRDKDSFNTNLSRSRIDFLKASINHVIGYNEVIDAFTNFRINFFNKLDSVEKTKENIEKYVLALFPKEVIQKPMLSLYFHQELVAKSVVNRIKEKPQSDKPHYLCVGVLPRGGKSFIAGGIMNLHKKMKAKEGGYNVLFLTSAVTETITQFKEDLINKFSDYDDFEFVDVREGDKSIKKNKFYFISRQLSSGTTRQTASDDTDVSLLDNENILQILERKLTKIPEIDICFFDEAHIGIISKTVRENFNKTFNRFKIPIVLMTATYKKPAILLESSKDLFVWDLQDIKEMKTLEVLNLPEFLAKKPDVLIRYPIAEEILKKRNSNGENELQLAKPYLQFPNPNFISLTFSPDEVKKLVETGGGYSFMQAFDINNDDNLLSDRTKAKDWSKLLVNKEDAIRLRQFLTPEEDINSQEENQFPILRDKKERKFRALNQIFSIAQKNGSRPYQGKPFSILMFLPWGEKKNGPIGSLCRIWASFMLQSVYWQNNFVFLTLSKYGSKTDKKQAGWTLESGIRTGLLHREDFDSSKELKDIILETEKAALKEGKGLVLLSGDVAKMGISLKCVDVVFMMSNKKDADDIIQKMYRALTDNPPNKKDGFIVDLDLKRIITAMFEYDLEKDRARVGSLVSQTTEERLVKIFELCNWGQDSFIEDNPDKNFTDIMDEIKRKVLGDLEKKILKTFDQNGEEIKKKQIEIIVNNIQLYNDIKATLETTSAKTKGKSTPVVLATRGEGTPELSVSRRESEEKDSKEKEEDEKPPVRESRIPRLTEEQIQAKIMYILKTFVNALVLKSSEPWDKSLNLISLLEKYKKDEKLLGGKEPVCDCTSNGDCTTKHDNLYESSYCELKSYAMNADESGTFKYDLETHKRIMILINDIFTKNSVLIEWNTYIESLLAEMRDAKVKSRVSRRSRKLNRR
jgi:hypothetical protein